MEKYFLLAVLALVAVEAKIEITLNYDKGYETERIKFFDIKLSTDLKCSVASDTKQKLKITWTKREEESDGPKELAASERVVFSNGENYSNVHISKMTEDDTAVYTCVVYDADTDNKLDEKEINLRNNYRIKSPDNVNIIEGEKLTLTCAISGKPKLEVFWENSNGTLNMTDPRYEFREENGFDNAVFIIHEARMSDRDVYKCEVRPEQGQHSSHSTNLRVKDKYAALWPFLGICAEVFILCAIILIYEKKRNKSELEESDTDQSPDQKNTPDHGKEANLRHRN